MLLTLSYKRSLMFFQSCMRTR